MKNKVTLMLSALMFVAVLIGINLAVLVEDSYPQLEAFAPMIVISGFFTFLTSVGLFIYTIVSNLKN